MRRNGGRRGFFSIFRDGGLFLATVFLGILIAAKLDQINSETHTGRFFVIDGDTLQRARTGSGCSASMRRSFRRRADAAAKPGHAARRRAAFCNR
ncbi:hypothetical protein AGR1B_Cc30015 [Agrobacterium fabacearum S56]|nr:hypothetical protein AGR1B_Cc30015 [Agrobacterium fabacearum S56]